MPETSDGKIRCPSCDGIDIRHSWRRGMLDAFMGAFGKLPHRCRRCQRRFYVHTKRVDADDAVRPEQAG